MIKYIFFLFLLVSSVLYGQSSSPPLGTPINSSHNLSQTLLLCLPMNEDGGMILNNVAGLGKYNGSIIGTAGGWYPANTGEGFKLNAIDNYITSLCPTTTLMTTSFWVRIPSAPLATDNIGILWWDGTSVENCMSAVITGTNPDIGIYKSNSAAFRTKSAQTALKDGRWHQCVFVINQSSAAATDIYIDGTVLTSYTTTANQTFDTPTGFNVNHFAVAGTSRFSLGIFKEIMVWNRMLTSTEVRQLYVQSYSMFQN